MNEGINRTDGEMEGIRGKRLRRGTWENDRTDEEMERIRGERLGRGRRGRMVDRRGDGRD